MQIVLIPGLMNDGWIWRHQIGQLSRITSVTIARTDGCDSLAAMADRILGHTAGPLMVIGHSMGGRVALEVVARAPERVKRLALLDLPLNILQRLDYLFRVSGRNDPLPGKHAAVGNAALNIILIEPVIKGQRCRERVNRRIGSLLKASRP